ncbi:hypothetical protein SAMD00019534_106330 [Acytostelium subglobosum LB1]|uniref:hypothetical protein n=1 Tax=Acytostelium subglobosum LB1 TaxID=1410327 RepID=UPI000644881C|nr:hypothetical protein SAMD00019534_106330 [Acytostelium subglobosum LB1]GAM27457.1 hypothetical protein SAMD00019534_106330 [Acytostelium subglobosum LB1]|eukprot:XP_012749522.1 hypothetical protein SAMD00019534_106330 [Acytostelium subglobosum LB1]
MQSTFKLFVTIVLAIIALSLLVPPSIADVTNENAPIELDLDLKGAKTPLTTDSEVVQRENEAIKSEGYSVAEQKLIQENAEKFTFQAEVNKLMNIIINSLYSKKEIFLRELISNASDALDKIRFLALTNPALLGDGDQSKLDIRIMIDNANKVLHIIDRGIGMTKDDLIKNLGTIAQSGTKDFINKLAQSNDTKDNSNLIGQFGVGFYSLFLVADNVIVTSKHNDDDQYVWTSTSDGTYSITKDPKGNTLGRGTRISMHLKEDSYEYLSEGAIKELVKKYSQFINFPIYLYTSHQEDVPIEDETPVPTTEDENKVETNEEEEDGEDEAPVMTKTIDVYDWEMINDNKPLWTRSPKEVTDQEYNDFYKTLTKSSEEPLAHSHFVGEGGHQFRSIIYIPSTPPTNVYDPESMVTSIKLFVRRVFITDSLKDIIPSWLRFLQGIIDSDDLPLNVSREILQQHKILEIIKNKIIAKFLTMVQDISNKEDRSEYYSFYKKYGNNLKFGVIDEANSKSVHIKNRLIKLLMFPSSQEEHATLDTYVKRMKEGQNQIYFISGKSKETLESSPLIEQALKRGYEVLYMVDPIDEYLIPQIPKYNEFTLTNLAREGVKFDNTTDVEADKQLQADYKPLTDFLKQQLGKKIERVVVSKILADSPCALVTNQWGVTANMERIIKAQSFGAQQLDERQMEMMNKKIMEINPEHPLIKQLLERVVSHGVKDEMAQVSAQVLYETSALSSGFIVDNPSNFAKWIYKMMEVSGEKISEAKYQAVVPEQSAPAPVANEDILDVNIDENDEMSLPNIPGMPEIHADMPEMRARPAHDEL